MSRAVFSATGKVYGLQGVCRVLGVARSTVYARRKAVSNARPEPAKRSPKPAVSDAALLEAIRTDLAASPFHAIARCGRG